MPDPADDYARLSQKTAADLKTILAARSIPALSHLTLPEIDQLTRQIAQVIPAGNVPGLIFNGLTRLEGRRVAPAEQQRYLNMLFRGMRDMLNKAVYGAFFAGPAAVILGYQRLLQLAGKDVDSAFPEGTWQFYLEFALREDTARHVNETIGFQRSLAAHQIDLGESDQLAAWIMAALSILWNYEHLLENEWRERICCRMLSQIAGGESKHYADWERQRPYQRGQDAGNYDYPTYRRRKFDIFLESRLASLDEPMQAKVRGAIDKASQEALPAYIRQMSILARLDPGQYQESRVPYTLAEARLAVIYRGHYYLFPVLTPEHNRVDAHTIRRLSAALLNNPDPESRADLDLLLARAERTAQPALRAKADSSERDSLAALGCVPIILNWDRRDARLPLAAIRHGRRGIGDHALTLFFTEESTAFDQSHIFFDGAWGAALAEIITNEALSWALYFAQSQPVSPSPLQLPRLVLASNAEVRGMAERARLPAEATAESTAIRLGPVIALRRLFKSRNDLITVSVNDLLILNRVVHGQRYQPSPLLDEQLAALQRGGDKARQEAHALIVEALDKIRRSNPAILIPMDASQAAPHERLYPTTFRNPIGDLLNVHDDTLAALRAYQSASGDRTAQYQRFDEGQRHYLRVIASFGALMRQYKHITLAGQSLSTTTIKLLAHIPDAMKHLLDEIPGRFDLLNEIIKGEEVFSNIGRVAAGSTLRRFISAKDDNRQKSLVWGVLTDDQDVVHLSLRDFRPHVSALHDLGMASLADLITRDFLDSYADGFNRFVRELREITLASRETRPQVAGKEANS